MRARLVRMEPGYRGRQRIVIEIAGDFREQFDQLQGALLEVQITRAIPRRSLWTCRRAPTRTAITPTPALSPPTKRTAAAIAATFCTNVPAP